MSTEQPGADVYGQELARISHHQSAAIEARFTVFQALAAVGIGNEEADGIVSKLEAGAVAGAHTWISESSAPHGSNRRSVPQAGTAVKGACPVGHPAPGDFWSVRVSSRPKRCHSSRWRWAGGWPAGRVQEPMPRPGIRGTQAPHRSGPVSSVQW